MEKKINDKFKMDSNKMLWHLDNIVKWQKSEDVAPIAIEMSLSKGCNQRCIFCFGKFQGNKYKKGYEIMFSGEPLFNFLKDAAFIGVKSICLIGEGESLLNPDIYDAVAIGRDNGIDMALGTNGELLKNNRALELLRNLTYIRFSVSAGTNEGYKAIHKVEDGIFEKVIKKISFCVNLKRKYSLNTTIGLQMVLMPDTISELLPLVKLGKELGVDYLVVKHCSDSAERKLKINNHKYLEYGDIFREAESFSDSNYNVVIKWSKLTNEGKKKFNMCLGVPFFMMRVSGDGKLFPCAQFFNYREDEFIIADLKKERFKDVMFGKRYKEVAARIKALDVHNECMTNCKENSINEFLWELQYNKPEHINFV